MEKHIFKAGDYAKYIGKQSNVYGQIGVIVTHRGINYFRFLDKNIHAEYKTATYNPNVDGYNIISSYLRYIEKYDDVIDF